MFQWITLILSQFLSTITFGRGKCIDTATLMGVQMLVMRYVICYDLLSGEHAIIMLGIALIIGCLAKLVRHKSITWVLKSWIIIQPFHILATIKSWQLVVNYYRHSILFQDMLYNLALIFSIIMNMMIAFIAPFIVHLFLKQHTQKHKIGPFRRTWGPLYASYKGKFYWWHSISALRWVMVCLLIESTREFNILGQMLIYACTHMMAYICSEMIATPYRKTFENKWSFIVNLLMFSQCVIMTYYENPVMYLDMIYGCVFICVSYKNSLNKIEPWRRDTSLTTSIEFASYNNPIRELNGDSNCESNRESNGVLNQESDGDSIGIPLWARQEYLKAETIVQA